MNYLNRYKYSLLKILLMTFVVFAGVFRFRVSYNEFDVLPYAWQFFDKTWIPQDWYLNLNIEYRYFFNYFVGWSIDTFGFLSTLVVGRLFSYFLFATAYYFLLRIFKLNFHIGILLLAFFICHQSIAANEWLIGGLESKVFAYAFSFMGLVVFLRRNYLVSFLFMGLALSFHLLIGIYALYCLVVASLLNYRSFIRDLMPILKSVWVFILSGALGLHAIGKYLLNMLDSSNNSLGWDIYVNFRVPHHTVPDWSLYRWMLLFSFTLLHVIVFWRSSNKIFRFISSFSLASVSLTAVGLIFYYKGQTGLLKYYWFRYTDTAFLLLSQLLILKLFWDKAEVYLRIIRSFFRKRYGKSIQSKAFPYALYLSSILFALGGLYIHRNSTSLIFYKECYSKNYFQEHSIFDIEMAQWIRENTEPNSMFLIPQNLQDFYLSCNRAVVVSFKHSPQKSEDILEWYDRLLAMNRGESIEKSGGAAVGEINGNYQKLDEREIIELHKEYGANYFLVKNKVKLNLPLLYSTSRFNLYQIVGVGS